MNTPHDLPTRPQPPHAYTLEQPSNLLLTPGYPWQMRQSSGLVGPKAVTGPFLRTVKNIDQIEPPEKTSACATKHLSTVHR